VARKKSGRTEAQRAKGGRCRSAAKSSAKGKEARGTRVAAKAPDSAQDAGGKGHEEATEAAPIQNYSLHIENEIKTHFRAIVGGLVEQAKLGRTTATKLLFRWGGMEEKLGGPSPEAAPVSLAAFLLNELEKRSQLGRGTAAEGGEVRVKAAVAER
jgi:hypothetical protein